MENKEKNSNIFTITDSELEPYYIQFDPSCYTGIKRVKSGTSDRVREQIVGYYTSLESCIDAIAEDSIKNRDYESLQEFIAEHKLKLEKLKQIKIK